MKTLATVLGGLIAAHNGNAQPAVPAEFEAAAVGAKGEGLIYEPDPRTTLGVSGTVEITLAIRGGAELGGDACVLARGEGTDLDFEIIIRQNRKDVVFSNGFERLEMACDFTDGQFHHVAFCIDPEGSRGYFDGESCLHKFFGADGKMQNQMQGGKLRESFTIQFGNPDGGLRQSVKIGGAAERPPSLLSVKTCRLWARALSQPECKSLVEVAGRPPFEDGLVAWTLYTADRHSLVLNQAPLGMAIAGSSDSRASIGLVRKGQRLSRIRYRVNGEGVVDDLVFEWLVDRDHVARSPSGRTDAELSTYSTYRFEPAESLVGIAGSFDGKVLRNITLRTTKSSFVASAPEPSFPRLGVSRTPDVSCESLFYIEVPPDGVFRGGIVAASSSGLTTIGLLYSKRSDEDPTEEATDATTTERFVVAGDHSPVCDDALAWAYRDENWDAPYVIARDAQSGEAIEMPRGRDLIASGDADTQRQTEINQELPQRAALLQLIESAAKATGPIPPPPPPPSPPPKGKSGLEKFGDAIISIFVAPDADAVTSPAVGSAYKPVTQSMRDLQTLMTRLLGPAGNTAPEGLVEGEHYGEMWLTRLRNLTPGLAASKSDGLSTDFKERLVNLLLPGGDSNRTTGGMLKEAGRLRRAEVVRRRWHEASRWRDGIPAELLPYRLSLRPHGLFTSQTVYVVARERGTSRLLICEDAGRTLQLDAKCTRPPSPDILSSEQSNNLITPGFPLCFQVFTSQVRWIAMAEAEIPTHYKGEGSDTSVVARVSPQVLGIRGFGTRSIQANRVTADISASFPDKIPWGGTFSLSERPTLIKANFRGYNGRQVSPRKLMADTESAPLVFRYPSDPGDDYRTTDSKLIIPDGLFLVVNNTSEETSVVTATSRMSEHEDSLMSSVGAKTSLSAGLSAEGVGFSIESSDEHKNELKQVQAELQQDESSIATWLSTQVRYSLVADMSRIHLSEEFIAAVHAIREAYLVDPRETTEARIKTLLQTFGTHYAYAVTYGGEARFEQVLTKTAREASSSLGMSESDTTKLAMSLSGSVDGMGGSLGYSREDSTGTGSETKDLLRTELSKSTSRFTTLGGTSSRGGGWSLGRGEEVPIRYDLRPLVELLSPVFFDDPLVFGTIRRRVERAMAN